jgi:hypothetical protein
VSEYYEKKGTKKNSKDIQKKAMPVVQGQDEIGRLQRRGISEQVRVRQGQDHYFPAHGKLRQAPAYGCPRH